MTGSGRALPCPLEPRARLQARLQKREQVVWFLTSTQLDVGLNSESRRRRGPHSRLRASGEEPRLCPERAAQFREHLEPKGEPQRHRGTEIISNLQFEISNP